MCALEIVNKKLNFSVVMLTHKFIQNYPVLETFWLLILG